MTATVTAEQVRYRGATDASVSSRGDTHWVDIHKDTPGIDSLYKAADLQTKAVNTDKMSKLAGKLKGYEPDYEPDVDIQDYDAEEREVIRNVNTSTQETPGLPSSLHSCLATYAPPGTFTASSMSGIIDLPVTKDDLDDPPTRDDLMKQDDMKVEDHK